MSIIIRETNEYEKGYYGDYIVEEKIRTKGGKEYDRTRLDIDNKAEVVYTDCGDEFYDFGFSFDEFLQIADKIRELKEAKMK